MDALSGVVNVEEIAALLAKQGLSADRLKGRSIALGVPVYRDISPWHYASMIQTISLLSSLEIDCQLRMVIGMPVADARNAIANRMLATAHTDLIFIDADEGWNPFDIVRLIASGLPMVAGVGKKKSTVPESDLSAWCASPLVSDGNISATDAGFVEAEYCGTGMLLINRTVFEKMISAHPEWKRESIGSQKEEFYEFFANDLDETGTRRNGEDISFCMRWRALGGSVFIDPRIVIHHYGTYDYTGDFSQFFDHLKST